MTAITDQMEALNNPANPPTPLHRSRFIPIRDYRPRSPSKQKLEYGQRPARDVSSMNEWLDEFNENRANIPGVYNRKQDQIRRLGGELPPRNTFWDDEPSVEALSQIRTMNAIKDADALINRYESLNNLTVPLSNKGNNMPAPMYPTQTDRGNAYQKSRFGFGGPNDALTSFQDNRRDHIKNYGINPGAAGNVDMSGIDFGFMDEDAISRAMAEQGIGGYDAYKMAGDNIGFGTGDLRDPPPGEEKTDWLGWAGVGTGLLSGVGGILDYFNNKKGLALTEDAINRKYAAFDREYLARANTADNILAGRKDFIEKTHANPDSSHLQYINRANA